MAMAQPVRSRLLRAYDAFLSVGFDSATVAAAEAQPNTVHFASATPGGAPWSWSLPNLIAELP
jgi:hypothetical protein